MILLVPAREISVSDIPAGDGKIINLFYSVAALRRYDKNRRYQMQGGKNWILPKEINANRFFWDSHWLEIWQKHLCPSMGPKGGSVAKDFEEYGLQQDSTPPTPSQSHTSWVQETLAKRGSEEWS